MRGSNPTLGVRMTFFCCTTALLLLTAAFFSGVLYTQQSQKITFRQGLNSTHALSDSNTVTSVGEASQFSLIKQKKDVGVTSDDSQEAIQNASSPASNINPDQLEKLIDGLREISASYDPRRLGEIESYLYSSNPAIRSAAVEAVFNLGDKSGAELLHRASRSMLDPKEETETLEKAAFLRLPPCSFKTLNTRK